MTPLLENEQTRDQMHPEIPNIHMYIHACVCVRVCVCVCVCVCVVIRMMIYYDENLGTETQ